MLSHRSTRLARPSHPILLTTSYETGPQESRKGGHPAECAALDLPDIQFFSEDIVRHVGEPRRVYMVGRSWHDADDQGPPLNPSDPLDRPLQKGEFGITDIELRSRHIAPESEYELVDRTFRVGDVCKRGIDDVASAVVLDVWCELRLKHAISGVEIPEWIQGDAVEPKPGVMLGDYVVCDDWVGQVEEVFDEAIILINDKEMIRVADMGGRFAVGDRGTDILPATGHSPFVNGTNQCILEVQPSVLAISWLAVNQWLTPEESANRPRPQRFWTATDLSRLTYVKIRSESVTRVPDRVRFKDPEMYTKYNVVKTRHRGESGRVLEVDTMLVTESRSTIKIMWQDGRIEETPGTSVIPYLNVDEYDCWPGDFVRWKNEDESRVAVVQSTDAKQRTARVMWYDPSSDSPPQTEVVSVLELDPHGPSGAESFGVRRGDFVFLHRPGTTNGAQLPAVPRIGELEDWVREPPPMQPMPEGETHTHSPREPHFHTHAGKVSYDVTLAEAGWRGEMAQLGMRLAEESAAKSVQEDIGREIRVVKASEFKGGNVDWFGEVINLTTTGLIEVIFPHGEKAQVPLERVTLLNNEGMDDLGLWPEDDGMSEGDSEYEEDVMEEVVYPDGMPPEGEEEVDGWETEGSEDDDMESAPEDWPDDVETESKPMSMPGGPIPASPTLPPTTPAPTAVPASALVDIPSAAAAVAASTVGAGPSTTAITNGGSILDNLDEENSPWHRFEILPTAPADHAYYATKSSSAQPPKTFLTRLSKEYKVLASSLPNTILVRAYEDRSDLLRCLIIGPQNTPYEDAPFVIDWFLDSSFPQTPPQAHFWSWTNGNGRVNPNLYEEGKVCLSILGTWSGDKNESWSAARSSLLQALVSIQGLVLVKEPWFCEPAYDKLRGTEEGIVNSEKAYVLSRGFVRRALEIEISGLASEVNWYYIEQGRLNKVISDARELIERSEAGEYEAPKEVLREDDPAVPVLSAGAVIMLKRTLDKLQSIADQKAK
ncbi:ubiquitin-conjugating enzyme [Ceratobasidium sp. AG-Ba]|nr:ubiquitin-conjugating enzyme [Ceratobasidium sp. AG-Ba]